MAMNRALVVGMNNYPNPRNNLPSCIDDANQFTDILAGRYGFQNENIHRLFNDEATLQRVSDELFRWLFRDAQPDDRLVFYFSGHGWRTEKDGVLRECLCVYDDFLFDTTLVQESQALPAGVLTLVLDSCHSGGLSKPFFVEQTGVELTENKVWRPDGAEQDDVAVAEKRITPIKPFGRPAVTLTEPPLEAAKTFQTEKLFADAVLAHESDPELEPRPDAADEGEPELNGLLVSACRADETAAASTSQTVVHIPTGAERKLSAFTFALSRSLDALEPTAAVVGQVTARRLLDATAAELKRLGFRQTPVLQETGRSVGFGERTFVTLRGEGGSASPAPVGGGAPATGVGVGAGGLSPDLQRLLEELMRALRATNGHGEPARDVALGIRGRNW